MGELRWGISGWEEGVKGTERCTYGVEEVLVGGGAHVDGGELCRSAGRMGRTRMLRWEGRRIDIHGYKRELVLGPHGPRHCFTTNLAQHIYDIIQYVAK